MSLEASTLSVVVKSAGVSETTQALNKLAQAGDKAERSTAKLAKAGATAEASAKRQEKVWYDLLDKVSKAHEREYNALQRHNNRIYGLVQAEANKMNKLHDRVVAQDAANAARRRKQEQDQIQQLDVLRRNAAAKEYARAQAEANRMNSMLDRARKQQEAAAKASAERQRVLNSTYSTSSLAQQIQTLQRAQAYGNTGGNVTSRFGSNVAGAMSSGELQRLQQQYRQLGNEARRANGLMNDSHAAVRGLSGSLGALWLTYGNILPLVAGAAVGAAIKGIVAVGKDIEHTLEKIRVLGQASTAEIDQMRDTVYSLGQGVQGPQEVANALSVLTLAGLNAKEALQGVQGALNLSVVGDIGIEQSAKTLVQVRTALGYTAADFDHIADVIAKTAAVSMSSVESISGAFLSAAAVGEVYGATLQDIAVGLAAVANLGIQGTAAGTTLKNFYKDLSAGGDKATKVLKDMGLSMRDLKDEDGFFLSMDKLLPKLNDGFSTLNKLARPEAMDKLFGERGVKTGAALIAMINQVSTEVDALGNKYANKFEEVFDQINKAAAFSTLGAIAMAQTTTNQLKSVGTTLQTVLGKAFAEIAPQIGDVAREMKNAFNSPEFMEGIKTIAIGVANLTKFLVTHLDVIAKVVMAYAAFKLAAFAAGLVEVAKGFTLASIGAKAFSLSLGPIAIAITAMATAWAIYKANKDKALNNNTAASNLTEFADGVVSAAEKEKEALEMRKRGESEMDIARKAQMDADKEASAAAIKKSQQGLDAMKKQMAEEYASLSDYQKKRIALVKAGKAQFTGDSAAQDYLEQERSYNDALTTHANQVKVVTSATEALIKTRQKNGELADKASRQNRIKPTGENDLTQAPDKEASKQATFLKNETLELNKLLASYNAKNAAMRKTIELGKIVAAETQQMLVLENLAAGKYGANKSESNEVYQKQKALAIAIDTAKAENERLHKHREFADKLTEVEAAQAAFNQAAVDGSNAHIGALRKEAEGIIHNLSLTKDQADALRTRADAADSFRKQQEWLTKLESATANSNERATGALDEAKAMNSLGTATKLSAIYAAELLIQKRKLTEVGSEATVSALREAAATEQLNDAYRDLVKQKLDMYKDLEDAEAASLLTFVDSEMERVRIAEQSRKAIAAATMATAQEAFDKKAFDGTATFQDVATINAANEAYEKTLGIISKISKIDMDNLSTKKEIKKWKELGDTIENSLSKAFGKAGEAAGKMFNLFAQGQARNLLVTKQVGALKEAQEKDGIDRTLEINEIQQHNAQMRISEYAGMADAAKGFFSEGSRGYEAMTKASKVLHAAEVALSLIKGVNAILTQGSGDPYSAFARMAAMTAMVAALGVAVSGGGGGGMSSASKQSVQGTGSVLGSSTRINGNKVELVGDKSESITKSLSTLEKNSGLGLSVDNQMLLAMRNLSNGISKLATTIVRDSDLTGKGLPTKEVFNSKGVGVAGGLAGGVAGAAAGAYVGMGTSYIGAMLGGPLGMAIGALVGALIGKTFLGKALGKVFGGKVTNEDVGFTMDKATLGSISQNGVQAFQYADMKKDGGWFRSDKNWTDKTSVGDGVNSQFTKIFQSMGDALAGAAEIFGVGGDAFIDKLNSFVIDVGQISLKGLTGEEIEKELQAIFSKAGDEMAIFAFDNLAQYQKIGEGMLETVARVANEFSQFNDVLKVLGRDVTMGMDAVATSQKVIAAFGNIENLTGGVADYMQNILTEEQRLAITSKALAEGMARINLSAVKTKEGFKAVVDSLDLTKEADIELFRSLMQLAPAFAQVTDAAKDAADKLAEANKAAMEAAIGSAENALDALSRTIDKEKDVISEAYEKMIDSVRKKADVEKEAAQKQLDAAQKQRDAISTVLDSLKGAMQSVQVESAELTRARRVEAQGYLQMAAIQVKSGGDVTKLPGLNNALEMIAKPSENLFSTFEDYARDQAQTANVISNLAGSAQTQLSAAELTIERINATIEAINKNADSTIEVLEKNRALELENLDKMLEKAQSQIDAIHGVDNSIQSLSQALMGFAASMAGVTATQVQQSSGTAAAIQSLYQNILGRSADKEGAEYWNNAVKNGTSVSAVADAMKGSQEYTTKVIESMYQTHFKRAADPAGLKFWQNALETGGATLYDIEKAFKDSDEYQSKMMKGVPSFDVGTNFVPHDMIAQVHKGEMIIPASDTSDIKRAISQGNSSGEDISSLKAEIREMKAAIMAGDLATVQTLKEILRLEKKWDQEGQPEVRDVSLVSA